MNKHYAICLWGELRGVKATVTNLYEHLVNPLEADLLILCQRALPDDEERLALLSERCVYKELYDKPDANQYLGQGFSKLSNAIKNNWSKDSNVQQYINFHKYAMVIANQPVKYERYIFIRTDFMHILPFPDIITINPDTTMFWCYNGHNYGGVNYTMIAVPHIHVNDYLTGPYHYITDDQMVEQVMREKKGRSMNCEEFMNFIFTKRHWSIGTIKHNAYLTAETTKDRTTWASIQHDEKHNVLYKYREQVAEAFDMLEAWKKTNTWVQQVLVKNKYVITVKNE
jgi:hypothetical protein